MADRALNDRWVERLARTGIVSRGVNYTVLALLVVAIITGHGGTEVDRRGAVEAIASAPFGHVLLLLLCVGFASYIAWQLLRAATRQGEQGAKDAGKRLLALGTAVIYAAFLFTTIRVLVGASTSSPNSTQASWTAKLLTNGGGRVAVIVAGAVVIVAGLAMAWYAASRRFESKLATWRMGPGMQRAATVLGVFGQVARGVVMVVIGGFVISAGLANDASRSKGLDASLRTLAGQPFGTAMLSLVALGFLAYGLYSFVDARYREDFSR